MEKEHIWNHQPVVYHQVNHLNSLAAYVCQPTSKNPAQFRSLQPTAAEGATAEGASLLQFVAS